ncbi:MAG: DUF5667 domain-containing protein [Candidatus Levyibacteriota bacterium]
MKRIYSILLALVLCILFSAQSTLASSSYVLPYPGIMPGNKLYKVSELFDSLKRYYAFGDFAQFSYNLSLSDKKLVEAKTLFEYNQYPLALTALQKSDKYFIQAFRELKIAASHNKDISDKRKTFMSAAQKHIEVLESVKKIVPSSFTWADEKKAPVGLNLWAQLDTSLKIRKTYE